ncbi:hypothetical protein [Umezawaea sp. Da 62-37]|uniref:hypothetical protein n=1 Tax=Umezawaea sp. Da 62-37 TaxID=3075927 RepID=UPI0028F6DE2D|nr:hypothetical protein [Umezawaea sp. Da 62-37]WNV83706.1 hypothetical protein RM788_36820 [Umezawaea sp. Da 62-37]
MDTEPADWVRRKVEPGARIARHGRTWRIGRTGEALGVLYGRIGYEREASSIEQYDEEQKDFVEYAIRSGAATPFAIELDTLVMAIQHRPPEISMGAAANALALLLSDQEHRWTTEPPSRSIPLSEWRLGVEKVTRARFVLRKPNPHYTDTPDLEALIDGADAETARLELQGAQLDLDSPFISQTLSHIQNNYGEARLTGVTSTGEESTYSTTMQAEELTTEAGTNADGEVDLMSLLQAVAGTPNQDHTD